jgi:outer membrane protein TolC
MTGRRAKASAFALLVCFTTAPDAARALDLDQTLREVAAANPALEARAAMAEAARRRVAPAGAWPAPMLELGVVDVPVTGEFDRDPMTMKMLGLSQRVPLFGSRGLARRAAREQADGAAWAVEMARYDVFGMAVEAYADAYFAGALAGAARAHVGVMERLVESSRVRYEAGNGRLEEVLRAQAERAAILGDLATLRGAERAARARLDALRGVMPGAETDSLATPPEAAVPDDPSSWLAAVGADHPRLREMDTHVRHYRYAARAARRRAWPDLELKGSYGWRADVLATGSHLGNLEQDDMFSASVGLMLPIFAGAREGAEGAEMDAMARASEAERRGAELELRRDVAAAHAGAAAARRTVGLLADTVTAIQHRALEASWSGYRAGTTDLSMVFESAHRVYEQEVALVRARQELAHAAARMIALTGRADLLGFHLPIARSPR